jgi:tetratricopeptide (TPR) repeat protein
VEVLRLVTETHALPYVPLFFATAQAATTPAALQPALHNAQLFTRRPVELPGVKLGVDVSTERMVYVAATVAGIGLQARGEMTRALPFFDKALAVLPTDVEVAGLELVHFQRANVLFHLGRVGSAITDLERAVQLREDFYEAQHGLAVAYATVCTPEKSIQEALAASILAAQQAVRISPDEPDAQQLLAELYLQAGQYEEALEGAQTAARFGNNDAEIQTLLASIYDALGRTAEAQAARAAAINGWEERLREPASAGRVDALIASGDAYRSAGRHEDALAKYLLAQQEAPEDGRAAVGLGLLYHAQGDYGSAEVSYLRATQLAYSEGTAQLLLGILYNEQGPPGQAKETLQRAVALLPCHATPHTALAYHYWQQDDLTGYAAELQTALLITPDDSLLLYSLGSARLFQQEPAEAAQLFSHALQVKHPFTEASLGLGEAYFSMEEYARAAVAWEQALTTMPVTSTEYALYAAAIGQAYVGQGNWEQAISAYERALAVQETSGVRYALGLLYAMKAQDDLAIAEFTRALALDPENAEAKTALAQAQERLKQP